MSVFGGSVQEISVSNPNVEPFFLFPLDGESNTLNLGGYRNDENPPLDGAGRIIVTKKQLAGKYSGPVTNDMATSREYNLCVACAASTADTVFTFQMVNGEVFKGVGVITGDMDLSTDKSTFDLMVQGIFTQQ
jgi:hypothetical protein